MTSYVKPAGAQTIKATYLARLNEQLHSIKVLIGYLQENKNYTKIQELEDLAEKIQTWINVAYDDFNSRVESYIPSAVPFTPHI